MQLKVQKRLAAQILKRSPKRAWFDNDKLEEIKSSITKADLRGLIIDGAIKELPEKGVSRFRAKIRNIQRNKGRQKGPGSKQGSATARLPRKRSWIKKVRSQRNLLRSLKDGNLVDSLTHRDLYRKVKGGFFRSRRHI